jgi:hypothetical protein
VKKQVLSTAAKKMEEARKNTKGFFGEEPTKQVIACEAERG